MELYTTTHAAVLKISTTRHNKYDSAITELDRTQENSSRP